MRSGSFFMIFNAHSEGIDFTLPAEQWGNQWAYALDTAVRVDELDREPVKQGEVVHVTDHAFVLLERLAP